MRQLDTVQAAYDAVAEDYARLLPDLAHETPLDLAVLGTFAAATLPGTVADVGCGTGRVTVHLHALGLDVLGIDLSSGMVEVARRLHPQLRFEVGSALALEVADASCGGVLAWYSLMHTPPAQLADALAEFARVLAPGAPALLGFHVGDGPRTIRRAYGQDVAVPAFDVQTDQVVGLAEDAGLEVLVRLERAPGEGDRRPQGRVLARRPS